MVQAKSDLPLAKGAVPSLRKLFFSFVFQVKFSPDKEKKEKKIKHGCFLSEAT